MIVLITNTEGGSYNGELITAPAEVLVRPGTPEASVNVEAHRMRRQLSSMLTEYSSVSFVTATGWGITAIK